MRYTVTKQRVQVLGGIWWPTGQLAAVERDLSAHDLANIEDPKDRDAVERWVMLHAAGDFSSVVDWRADFHIDGQHIVHEWARGEESEMEWNDCVNTDND